MQENLYVGGGVLQHLACIIYFVNQLNCVHTVLWHLGAIGKGHWVPQKSDPLAGWIN